jgi:hypothetical protein
MLTQPVAPNGHFRTLAQARLVSTAAVQAVRSASIVVVLTRPATRSSSCYGTA